MILTLTAVTAGCGGKPCKDLGLYTIQRNGSDKHRVRPERGFEDLYDATWLAGGHRIAFNDGRLWWAMNEDGSDVRRFPEGGPTFAAPGVRIVWITKTRRAAGLVLGSLVGFRIFRPGKAPRAIRYRALRNNPEDVTLSPNGQLVAYTDAVADLAGIYIISTRAGPPRGLTQGAGPVWSPDGRKIAFVRELGDLSDVYVINADRSGQQLIAKDADQVAWSPDGRELVVTSEKWRNGVFVEDELHIVDLRGNVIRSLTSGDLLSLTWAPSNTIAYVQDNGDDSQAKCGD